MAITEIEKRDGTIVSFDRDKMLRFIRYLKNEFYSYGVSTKELVKDEKNNKTFHRTKGIDFYKIIHCYFKIGPLDIIVIEYFSVE